MQYEWAVNWLVSLAARKQKLMSMSVAVTNMERADASLQTAEAWW